MTLQDRATDLLNVVGLLVEMIKRSELKIGDGIVTGQNAYAVGTNRSASDSVYR